MSQVMEPAAPVRERTASRRGGIVALVAVVVVTALGVAGWHWTTSLDTLSGLGVTGQGPVKIGQTHYLDAGLGPVAPDLGSVEVTVDSVTASATVRFTTPAGEDSLTSPIEAVVCVRKPGTSSVGVATAADLASFCSSVHSLSLPESLDLGFETTQVLYVVPVVHPGEYGGFQMDVAYHQGVRHGTAQATTDMVLSTPAETTKARPSWPGLRRSSGARHWLRSLASASLRMASPSASLRRSFT
jgi:hypothetical protein